MTSSDDQSDAAARDARRQTRAGGPQRNRLDLSQASVTGPDDTPAATKLRARLNEAFTTTHLDACEHVKRIGATRSAIPIHWAAWRPDRAACAQCFDRWLVPDTSGHTGNQFCDLCGADRPTDYMQITQGFLVAHADVCDECQGKT